MSDLQTVSPHNLSVLPPAPPSSQTFDVVMGVYLPGVICVLGIVGNIVSLLVLSSDRGNYPTFMSLKALAASDVVLLFLALCQQVIPLFCVYIQCTNTFCRHLAYVRVYVWPMICITQMTSIWLTLLISAERYSAICRPLHAKRLQNKVRSAVVGIVLACVIYNTPRFFEFTPVVREGNLTFVVVGDTAMRRNMLYRYLYNTALYCLLVYIVPLCTLSFLNLNIMKQMRVAAHCWEQLNRQQQREVKATAIPLCIVVVFFVCGSQSLVSFILDAVFVDRSVSNRSDLTDCT